ncbi:ABC transporter substrate-binding protein [Sulfitobacter sp. EhC04]|uniref:TRAP transporter substrate-binding protein DctP n=1 Tax=Sulfitobacter sp. EhC04 TaxID=1849168 RepID=UPI0007F4278E|nr:TRAP transporter substrate-binding protein DctP [Sulfitobacter sp. EhC04]OAN75724.1 ABC transporter substrate-binding protein [Sulfitobacter sp. EhC04]
MNTKIARVAFTSIVLALPTFHAATAQEKTLRAVSAFPTGSTFQLPFKEFIDEVNAAGDGSLAITYVGGPEAIPSLEVANAVSTGVIDIALVPTSFYTAELPGAAMIKLATTTMPEQRQNGCFELLDTLHQDGMNTKYLGRTGDYVQFHLYLNKKIEEPDLSGLNLRVAATYQALFGELGANMVNTPPGDVYSALERGTVDGYGWPSLGIFDLGWDAHTKYRVDPGFYIVDLNFLVNADTWSALSDEQKALLESKMIDIESVEQGNAEIVEKELARQAEAGIETIEFQGDAGKVWETTAREAAIKEIAEADPEAVETLRGCLIPNE